MTDCISTHTGKPRAKYATEEQAREAAAYLRARKRGSFYAYKCERCGFWHLAMERDRIDVSRGKCSCRGSDGNPKMLYATKADALRAVENGRRRGADLDVYLCPEGGGWHLTHKTVGPDLDRRNKRSN